MSRLQQKSFRVSYLLEHTNEAGRGGGNSHILLEGFLVDGEVILIKFKRLCEVEAHGGEKYVILGRNTRPLWGGGKERVGVLGRCRRLINGLDGWGTSCQCMC